MLSTKVKQKNKRTTYKRITQQVRLSLIQRVIQNGQNLKNVINQMGVNISTAKAILKVFQEQQRIGKKKKRNKLINIIQTYSFYSFDGANIEKLSETLVQEKKRTIKSFQNQQLERQLKLQSKQKAEQLVKQLVQKQQQPIDHETRHNLNEPKIQQNYLYYPFCPSNYFFYDMRMPEMPYE